MKYNLNRNIVINHRGVLISGKLSEATNYTLTLIKLFRMVKVNEIQAAKLVTMIKYIEAIATDIESHTVKEIKRARAWWRAIKASTAFMVEKPYVRSVNDPYMRPELKERIMRFILTPTYSELVEIRQLY